MERKENMSKIKSLRKLIESEEEAAAAEQPKSVVLTVELTPTASESVLGILKALQHLGNVGASKKLVFDKDKDLNGKFDMGFDGDGPDKILSISVDGEPVAGEAPEGEEPAPDTEGKEAPAEEEVAVELEKEEKE